MVQDAFNLMADPKGRAGTSSAFNNAYLDNKVRPRVWAGLGIRG